VPPAVRETLRDPGRPLDAAVRGDLEPRLGHDFSRVRVHTDARAGESARAVGATAYTVGRDIAFAPGAYAPGTSQGRRLIAHELAHVVQQRTLGGGPTGTALRVGHPADAHERQADRLAADVARRRPVEIVAGWAAPCVMRQTAPSGPRPSRASVSDVFELLGDLQVQLTPEQFYAVLMRFEIPLAPVLSEHGYHRCPPTLRRYVSSVAGVSLGAQTAGTFGRPSRDRKPLSDRKPDPPSTPPRPTTPARAGAPRSYTPARTPVAANDNEPVREERPPGLVHQLPRAREPVAIAEGDDLVRSRPAGGRPAQILDMAAGRRSGGARPPAGPPKPPPPPVPAPPSPRPPRRPRTPGPGSHAAPTPTPTPAGPSTNPAPEVRRPEPGLRHAHWGPPPAGGEKGAAYARQVTGSDDSIYIGGLKAELGGTGEAELDGYRRSTRTLLDAKDTGAEPWYDITGYDRTPPDKFTVDFKVPSVLKSAMRQGYAMQKSGAAGIEWHLPNAEVAAAIRKLFAEHGIDIKVVVTPKQTRR
jgi:hypothetical protein